MRVHEIHAADNSSATTVRTTMEYGEARTKYLEYALSADGEILYSSTHVMSTNSTTTVLYGMTNEGLQYKAAAERILKKCDTAMDSCYAAPRLEMGQVFRLTFQPPPPPPPLPG